MFHHMLDMKFYIPCLLAIFLIVSGCWQSKAVDKEDSDQQYSNKFNDTDSDSNSQNSQTDSTVESDSYSDSDSTTEPLECSIDLTDLSELAVANGLDELFELNSITARSSDSIYAAGDNLFYLNESGWIIKGSLEKQAEAISAYKKSAVGTGSSAGFNIADINSGDINHVKAGYVSAVDSVSDYYLFTVQNDGVITLNGSTSTGSLVFETELTGSNFVTDILAISGNNIMLTSNSGLWQYKNGEVNNIARGYYTAVTGTGSDNFYASGYWTDDYGNGTNVKLYYYDNPANGEIIGLELYLKRIIKMWLSDEGNLYFIGDTGSSNIIAILNSSRELEILWEGVADLTDIDGVDDSSVFISGIYNKHGTIFHYSCR